MKLYNTLSLLCLTLCSIYGSQPPSLRSNMILQVESQLVAANKEFCAAICAAKLPLYHTTTQNTLVPLERKLVELRKSLDELTSKENAPTTSHITVSYNDKSLAEALTDTHALMQKQHCIDLINNQESSYNLDTFLSDPRNADIKEMAIQEIKNKELCLRSILQSATNSATKTILFDEAVTLSNPIIEYLLTLVSTKNIEVEASNFGLDFPILSSLSVVRTRSEESHTLQQLQLSTLPKDRYARQCMDMLDCATTDDIVEKLLEDNDLLAFFKKNICSQINSENNQSSITWENTTILFSTKELQEIKEFVSY